VWASFRKLSKNGFNEINWASKEGQLTTLGARRARVGKSGYWVLWELECEEEALQRSHSHCQDCRRGRTAWKWYPGLSPLSYLLMPPNG
jgi:hypothetical protein